MLRHFTTAYAGGARPLGPGTPVVRPAGLLTRAVGDECGRARFRRARGAAAFGRTSAQGQLDSTRNRFAVGGDLPFAQPEAQGVEEARCRRA